MLQVRSILEAAAANGEEEAYPCTGLAIAGGSADIDSIKPGPTLVR
jgi:hypothetical protein